MSFVKVKAELETIAARVQRRQLSKTQPALPERGQCAE
jgi:hypothetical protein